MEESMTPLPPKTNKNGEAAGEVEAVEGGKRNTWMTHVKKTMRAHPGKKLKEVLKIAKKTYTKTAKKTRKATKKAKSFFMGGSTVVPSPAGGTGPLTGGRRRSRRRM